MGYVIIDGELVHTSLLPRLNTEPLTWLTPEEFERVLKKNQQGDYTAATAMDWDFISKNLVAPIKSD